ncbi:MAG: hypothetical protein HY892_20020 [Deltaproteobacteria bacterium]|nr:hypothetical protein [Deltaproteobacteria bacterium]
MLFSGFVGCHLVGLIQASFLLRAILLLRRLPGDSRDRDFKDPRFIYTVHHEFQSFGDEVFGIFADQAFESLLFFFPEYFGGQPLNNAAFIIGAEFIGENFGLSYYAKGNFGIVINIVDFYNFYPETRKLKKKDLVSIIC